MSSESTQLHLQIVTNNMESEADTALLRRGEKKKNYMYG
jgi:hypothetical protein